MADRRRSIEVEFLVDDRDKRKLSGIGNEAGIAGKGFGALKGAVGGFVAAIGVREVVEFGVEIARMSEQAKIAGESAEKVLGPALQGLRDRFEEVRHTMGLNSGEFDTIVGKLGLLTDSMGLTDERQAEFIGFLIETGGELAAFRGEVDKAPEAIDAMTAAIRGEFDPLEQWGIKLSEAAIQEKMVELRAKDATGALSDQELRVMAVEELIREKAAPAIGSLAEAEDTLAGKTNAAKVKFDDLKIALGEKLLPIVSDAVDEFLALIEAIESGDASALTGYTGQIVREIQSIIDFVNGAIEAFNNLMDTLDRFTAKRGSAGLDVSQGGGGQNNQRTTTGGGNRRGSARRPPAFHDGGVVGGGATGEEVAIIAKVGEKVTPAHRSEGTVVNITVNALDPASASKAVVQAIQKYIRDNGGRSPF